MMESAMKSVEKWGVWELTLCGPADGNPFLDVTVEAVFRHGDETLKVRGFYDGDGVYKVRFMPRLEGLWQYCVTGNAKLSGELYGEFTCTAPKGINHGPVRVTNRFHFTYEDGARYAPIGTTCYAWIHQEEGLRRSTLETLRQSPFNKIRMCVFPKHYDYNVNDPVLFSYERDGSGQWDFTRFNPVFFRHLEQCVRNLGEIGVEADVILFHAYDKWGFAKMGAEANGLYLSYIVRRLSAFRNVWWSLANEYDLLDLITKSIRMQDWERFAGVIVENDPYAHLCSIHNCFEFYDHTQPWVTHCSVQRQDVYKTAEYTDEWRRKYQKPVVIDECGYEGNINHGWGNLPPQELMRRFWEGAVRGGYVGHGETYTHPEDILWWSKGGALYGQSPARIAFLKGILYDGPQNGLNPIDFGTAGWDLPCGGSEGEYYLFYFGFNQPSFRVFTLPGDARFRVDVIDTWDMTVRALPGEYSGAFRVELPGKSYMAVRMTKITG